MSTLDSEAMMIMSRGSSIDNSKKDGGEILKMKINFEWNSLSPTTDIDRQSSRQEQLIRTSIGNPANHTSETCPTGCDDLGSKYGDENEDVAKTSNQGFVPLPKLTFPDSWNVKPTQQADELDTLISQARKSQSDQERFWRSLFPVTVGVDLREATARANAHSSNSRVNLQGEYYSNANLPNKTNQDASEVISPRKRNLIPVIKAIGDASRSSFESFPQPSYQSSTDDDRTTSDIMIMNLLNELNLAKQVTMEFEESNLDKKITSHNHLEESNSDIFNVKEATSNIEIGNPSTLIAQIKEPSEDVDVYSTLDKNSTSFSTILLDTNIDRVIQQMPIPKESSRSNFHSRLTLTARSRINEDSKIASYNKQFQLDPHFELSFQKSGLGLPLNLDRAHMQAQPIHSNKRKYKASLSLDYTAASILGHSQPQFHGLKTIVPMPSNSASQIITHQQPSSIDESITSQDLKKQLAEAVLQGNTVLVRAILRQAFIIGMHRIEHSKDQEAKHVGKPLDQLPSKTEGSAFEGDFNGDVFSGRAHVSEIITDATYLDIPVVILAIARDDSKIIKVLNDAYEGAGAKISAPLNFVRNLHWPISLLTSEHQDYVPLLSRLVSPVALKSLGSDIQLTSVHWAQLLGARKCFELLASEGTSGLHLNRAEDSWTYSEKCLNQISTSNLEEIDNSMLLHVTKLFPMIADGEMDLYTPLQFPGGTTVLHALINALSTRSASTELTEKEMIPHRISCIHLVARELDSIFSLSDFGNPTAAFASKALLSNPSTACGIFVSDICILARQFDQLILLAFGAIRSQSNGNLDNENLSYLPPVFRLSLIWTVEHIIRLCPKQSSFRTKDLIDLTWLLVQCLPEMWQKDAHFVTYEIGKFLSFVYSDVEQSLKALILQKTPDANEKQQSLSSSLAYSFGLLYSAISFRLGINGLRLQRSKNLSDIDADYLHPAIRKHVPSNVVATSQVVSHEDPAIVGVLRSLVSLNSLELKEASSNIEIQEEQGKSEEEALSRQVPGSSVEFVGEGGGSSSSGQDLFTLVPTYSESNKMAKYGSLIEERNKSPANHIAQKWIDFMNSPSKDFKTPQIELHQIVRFRDLHQFISDYAFSKIQPTETAYNSSSTPRVLSKEATHALAQLANFELNEKVKLNFTLADGIRLQLPVRPPPRPAGFITQIYPTSSSTSLLSADSSRGSSLARILTSRVSSGFSTMRRGSVSGFYSSQGEQSAVIGSNGEALGDEELWSYYEFLRRQSQERSREDSDSSQRLVQQSVDTQPKEREKLWKPKPQFVLKPNENRRDLSYIPFDEKSGREWVAPQPFVIEKGLYKPNPKPIERPPPPSKTVAVSTSQQFDYAPTVPRKAKDRESMPTRRVGLNLAPTFSLKPRDKTKPQSKKRQTVEMEEYDISDMGDIESSILPHNLVLKLLWILEDVEEGRLTGQSVLTLDDVARFNPYLSSRLENHGRGPVALCSAWIRSWEDVWMKSGQARLYAFNQAYDNQIAQRAKDMKRP